MSYRLIIAVLALLAFLGGTMSHPVSSAAAPLTSTLADQSEVALTIYNSNIGLVKDVREIELGEGENE